MTAYEKMKAKVKAESNSTLLTAYQILLAHFDENSTFEETLTHSVLTTELESRGLIQFNESTWDFEIKVS